MRTVPKIALSLIITLVLITGISFVAYGGLFTLIETRFYQPAAIRGIKNQLDEIGLSLDNWHDGNFLRFQEFIDTPQVQRSVLPQQSREDIVVRAERAGILLSDPQGLSGIRILDAQPTGETGLRRIHYSTWQEDVLRQDAQFISWEHYGRDPQEIPPAALDVPDGNAPRLLYDGDQDRFIYAFPFSDSFGNYRGTALFYVSVRGAIRQLISDGALRLTDDIRIAGTPGSSAAGIIMGIPRGAATFLIEAVEEHWNQGTTELERIADSGDHGWILITRPGRRYGGLLSQVVPDNLFIFPPIVKILLLVICFTTLFLCIFLVFNLKQNDIVIIRSRIRRFQLQLVQDFMTTGEDVKWEEVKKTIDSRRHDISRDLKKSFGRRVVKRKEAEIDALLERSWDEIFSAMGKQKQQQTIGGTEELKSMLEQVLKNNIIQISQSQTTRQPASLQPVTANDIPEEIEDLDELQESVEFIEPEIIDDDSPDDIEELEPLEITEDLPELEPEAAEDVPPFRPVPTELKEVPHLVIGHHDAGPAPTLDTVDSIGDLAENVDIADFLSTDGPVAGADPAEVEYLDAEWEIPFLEEADETEIYSLVEDQHPDEVLVYNFEEIPHLDGRFGLTPDDFSDVQNDLSLVLTRPDYSFLDTDKENATPVNYLDPILISFGSAVCGHYAETDVIEMLEVVGEEEPYDLEEAVDHSSGPGVIVSKDGLYVISTPNNTVSTVDKTGDTEFKNLVDSVL